MLQSSGHQLQTACEGQRDAAAGDVAAEATAEGAARDKKWPRTRLEQAAFQKQASAAAWAGHPLTPCGSRSFPGQSGHCHPCCLPLLRLCRDSLGKLREGSTWPEASLGFFLCPLPADEACVEEAGAASGHTDNMVHAHLREKAYQLTELVTGTHIYPAHERKTKLK